jgi:hypothetical protein
MFPFAKRFTVALAIVILPNRVKPLSFSARAVVDNAFVIIFEADVMNRSLIVLSLASFALLLISVYCGGGSLDAVIE